VIAEWHVGLSTAGILRATAFQPAEGKRRQYHHLVPQCLVIAPSDADLSVLRALLEELDTGATMTAQLLAGAQLASVALNQFDFAVAVLPATGQHSAPTTPPAIYLEMGIALGRGLPLLVLAESTNQDLPSLGGLASNVWIVVGAQDEASIRLHLSLFTKVLAINRSAGPVLIREPPLPASAKSGNYQNATNRERKLEQVVVGLLEAGGALVEEAVSSGRGDRGVDAAALIPGAEQVLGPVLVEVKASRSSGLSPAVRNLGLYVMVRKATLGLLIYDGPRQDLPWPSGFPVVAMHVNDLRQHVQNGTLGRRLIGARNSYVHGSPGDA
jgi:hypothetical protein